MYGSMYYGLITFDRKQQHEDKMRATCYHAELIWKHALAL